MGSCRRASNSASFLHRDPDDDSYTGSDVWRLIGGSLHLAGEALKLNGTLPQ